MDRNTIIGIILIFLIFIGFSVYNSQKQTRNFNRVMATADSLYAKDDLENARAEYINALRFKPNQPEAVAKVNEINRKLGFGEVPRQADTTRKAITAAAPAETARAVRADSSRYGAFGGAVKGDTSLITLENSLLELKISPKGGRVYSARLKKYKTFDGRPLILVSGDSTVFGFNFFTADNKAVETDNLFFTPVSDQKVYDASSQPQSVTLRLKAAGDSYIEYKYTLDPGQYMVNLNVTFKSMQNIIAANVSSLTFDWRMYLRQQEKGRQNEENYSGLKYRYYQDAVEPKMSTQKKDFEQKDLPTKLNWVAFQDQFFSAILIADDYFQNGMLTSTKTPALPEYIRYYTAELGVPFTPGQESVTGLKLYYGPNSISILRKEGNDLENIVFLGRSVIGWISRFVIIPIFNWLQKYISSYGLIILILTVMIKIVLLPLTFKSYQSQAKMMVLKPLVDELGKKYPKKEDAMKKQQATMDLYKRAGANPMGGCLPQLLQFPILFAMFRFFPVSIELRQQHFLWATDLSTYDSILTLPFRIPIYGDHVSLFTILMTVSTLLTMRMTGSSPGQDQPGMKMMMYMMPVMFMLVLNNFSSGLTYYYFLANILTYLQNIISKRFIDADKVLAVLEENRKKPLKKSKWQQRLEQAARQRGINPPKR
ncbi:MAG: membrane protein insertase YidC [Bacteroidales bacterium]